MTALEQQAVTVGLGRCQDSATGGSSAAARSDGPMASGSQGRHELGGHQDFGSGRRRLDERTQVAARAGSARPARRFGHLRRPRPARLGAGRIISGSVPSTNSGGSERPQPRERSPPKPVSASRRNAALTGSSQRPRARLRPRNDTTVHRPAAGAKLDAGGGVALGGAGEPVDGGAPAHAGAERAGTSGGHQALAGAIHAPLVLVQRLARQHRLHHVSGTKRALFQRTRADISAGEVGGQMVRGGTTKPISSRNGKQELKHTAGACRCARGGVQPLLERAQARHGRRHRRVERVAVIDRRPRGCARPNRVRCARGRRDGV